MKRFLLLITYIIISTTYCYSNSSIKLPDLRQRFEEAAFKQNICSQLITDLEKIYTTNQIYKGYLGVTKIMMANHQDNIFTKWKYFRDGKKLLEESIAKEPNNIELRFLRLGIQLNVPSYIGYKSHIIIDKQFIVDSYKKIHDDHLKITIQRVLKEDKIMTQNDLRAIGVIK